MDKKEEFKRQLLELLRSGDKEVAKALIEAIKIDSYGLATAVARAQGMHGKGGA